MMKKILSIGLAVLFAASLCACTSSAAQSLMPEPTVAPTSAPEDIRTNFEKASAYVESLLDGKRMNASATSKVSALTEISMFTEGDDIALADVFTRIYEHTGGQPAISPKSTPEQLKAAFAEVLPEYDRDRVHVSDIKKCFSWFNILVEAGFTEFKLPTEE